MDIPPLLLQTLGSLVAILVLAGLAALMKLGGRPALAGEDDLRRAAGEVVDGYEPVEWTISSAGDAALARDRDGRVMLIKRHGNRFAGRILTERSSARSDNGALRVDCGEKRFGTVALTLDDAASWQAIIDAIGRT